MIENINEIKTQLDPEQVLRLIGYSKSSPQHSGNEIRDYCPIHGGDKQKSLSINAVTKLGKCHSCGFQGDLIELYSKSKNVDFDTSVKELTGYFGIEVKFNGAIKTNFPKRTRTPHQVLAESSPEGSHLYLQEKFVEVCPGLYFGKDEKGNNSIVVPLHDTEGALQSIQFIHGGGKYFLEGYPTNKYFFTIGSFKDGDAVYIAEGLATALTIWMALGKSIPVISFCSANNMMHVINALKNKYPNIKPIV